jgi:hypothetical protein
MIITGCLIAMLLNATIASPDHDHSTKVDFLMSIFITIIVWEGNLRLDERLNKKHPWLKKPLTRLVIQFPLSLLYSALGTYLPMMLFNYFICVIPSDRQFEFTIICVFVGLVVSVLILGVEISTQFFRNWKSSLVEVEKYKTESAQAQLQNLKEQVNPHFLFNNLSVLSSLVYKDQDKAVDFINQLSKVYRYLLDSRNTELISLQEELTFIKSYIYLLEIRFDTNIRFQIQIPDHFLKDVLPPMALQMLVENTIKHNEVSSEMPLTVSIVVQNNMLEVKNNLQPRMHEEESSKTGLNNIRERYKHYTDKKVEVISDAKQFIVRLPLLNKTA